MKGFLRFLKLVGLPLLIAVGIYTFIRFVWLADTKKEFSFVEISAEKYLDIYNNEEESVVFVTKKDSEKRNEYEQIIREKFDGKEITVYYYDITNLTEEKLSEFSNVTGLEKKYELPLLIYTLNGGVYDMLQGYQEVHYVIDFIERNNIG